MNAPVPHSTAIRKIILRLIPFLCLLFIVNYLDRTNVAMAKLQMLGDTGLTDKSYGLGAGLFFIGYFLFEVPSNLILHRVGARRWIARIMISWGILAAAMMFTRGARSFYLLRFLLGLAEAGFFPGIVLYLTAWVPVSQRSKILGAFLTSTALSGVIGTPLAGLIMKMEGIGGLHGWQWLFLLEGLPAVVLGVAILASELLPDGPANAGWITAAERLWIESELAADHSRQHVNHAADFRAAAADRRLWLFSVIYFLLIMGLYGFIYWVPTIVKTFTHGDNFHVGLVAAIPYFVAAVSMVVIGAVADRTGRRRMVVAGCAALGAIGIVGLCAANEAVWGVAALCVAAIGIFGTLGPFWTLPTRYLRHRAAAVGLAIINSTGALSGFVAPTVIGWAKQSTGQFTVGLLVVAASLLLAAVLILFVPANLEVN
ncbi:MAG TPA: MFS transporter [Tepidisphaeraceae bacterium]|nr:MFS transporter [Tepidisphaeraceae bacterium]